MCYQTVKTLKIICGISNSTSEEDIKAYVEAGVDEFFIGYIPKEWSNVYGWEVSCNRREHSNYHYYDAEELEEVVNFIHKYHKKVFLTLNAHEYNNQQIKLILGILNDIRHIPIDAFIVSNIAMMLELRNNGFDIPMNISIGGGSNSFESIEFYESVVENIGRYVLPRKLTMKEIEDIAKKSAERNIKLEAFGMADPCIFNDEYCFTWHGASNKSFCQSPMYTHKEATPLVFDNTWKEDITNKDISYFFEKRFEKESKIKQQRFQYTSRKPKVKHGPQEIKKLHILGKIDKCGLCAFQKFKEWGIEAIKLPLRGSHISTNLSLIELSKKIMQQPDATPKYCQKVLNSPNFCSGDNCFYNYPYSN